MNRTRMFAALLAALFVSAVGTGVWLGWDDGPEREVAVVDVSSTTTTTVARTTTTTRVSTTTTASPTTTTVPTTTTTRRPVTTLAPVTTTPPPTDPPATDPPVTEPPTTSPPTTAGLGYDPVLCARIRSTYVDIPTRHALLQLNNCPPHYFE